MQIKTALYNADHLEYGIVTIPFPIPKDQYDSTIKMLEAFDIGDPRERDCTVREVLGPVPSLKCLEGTQINVDELDYLVKRLDSFSDDEIAQFQAMAFKLGKLNMTGLINLTFCCQEATVITDFSDLEGIGRAHYMNLYGGGASIEELEQLDGVETALLLITENEGTAPPLEWRGGFQARRFLTSARTDSAPQSVLGGRAVSPPSSATAAIRSPGRQEGTPAWTCPCLPAPPSGRLCPEQSLWPSTTAATATTWW